MSERKTAEIKFRVTPSFKAKLQSAAGDAKETMSEYIEKAVDRRRSRDEDWTVPAVAGVAPEPPLEDEAKPLHPESEQAVALESAFPVFCAREPHIEGPCNGLPREDCPRIEDEGPQYPWMFRG